MDVRGVVAELDAAFTADGTVERSDYMKAYLKSGLTFRGVVTAGIRKRTEAFVREHREPGREELVALALACWEPGVYELRSFTVGVLSRLSDVLLPDDLDLVEELIRTSDNWASVDGLSTGVGAALVERHPDPGRVLDRWAVDEGFWVRRASMLVLLPALRRGEGQPERFLGYADRMLDEKEFFIRKAIGWVLREASKPRPETVYEFVSARVDRVSGVTVREAVKYLPAGQKDELMNAYRARPRASSRT